MPFLAVAANGLGRTEETKPTRFLCSPGAHTPRHFLHPQVQPSDCLEPEFTRKCQALLKLWREKVFALMVQLKAQELEHRGCVEQLKGQVAWYPLSPRLLPQLFVR